MLLAALIAALTVIALMARRGRARRKFRRYLKGIIDQTMALDTLGPNAPFVTDVSSVLDEQAWLSSVRLTWSLIDFSPGTQDGPLWVGVAHSDYTSAEIEAWIETTGSWTTGNKVQQETSKRYIRQVGVFANLSASAAAADALNDGRPITTKCGWMLATGQTVKLWVYNSGSGTLTTGASVHVNGHANLWPA